MAAPLKHIRVPVKVELKIPLWAKIILAAGIAGSVTVFLLLAWVVVKIVPPLVEWLDRH